MKPALFIAVRQPPAWLNPQAELPETLKRVRDAGLNGWEPFFHSVDAVAPLGALLQQNHLEMRSCSTQARLHDDSAPTAIENILSIARAARSYGAVAISMTLDTVRQDLPVEKGEYELRRQSQALEELGSRLSGEGLKLAYSTHAYEMRSKGREFHRMLQTTSPQAVGLGLAVDWIYQEAGTVALHDIVVRYASRIKTLYLCPPQEESRPGESAPGALDYVGLAQIIKANAIHPLLVLDCAFQQGAPETAPSVDLLRQSSAAVTAIFGE